MKSDFFGVFLAKTAFFTEFLMRQPLLTKFALRASDIASLWANFVLHSVTPNISLYKYSLLCYNNRSKSREGKRRERMNALQEVDFQRYDHILEEQIKFRWFIAVGFLVLFVLFTVL